MTVPRRAVRLLDGAIDLHVHVRPSVRNRRADGREVVEEASAVGMRAVLLKDHDRSTVADAWHANTGGSSADAFGAVCLNAPAGGINPAAVEAALRMGARAVFLPTDSARNDGAFWRAHLGNGARHAAVGEEPRRWTAELDALDASGPVPAILDVIDLCAASGALVCTGHLSADEVTVVVDECAARGARVLVTHAPMFTGAAPGTMAKWAAAGALLELVAILCCGGPSLPTSVRRSYAADATLIDEIGASAFVLSTDLGQAGNPAPAEGLGLFVDGLLGEGISADDIAVMTRLNPAMALGIGAAA
ncbi:MAG TPA: DUF6282 family protein [Acidimicrobiales bacterium]|nr:DUF6282 family protein [Acidimicrobiales bacterium]